MIRIALVDDHQLFREGIRALLVAEPELEVVAEAADAAAAMIAIAEARPDVVVLDLTLPGVPGVTVIRELRRTDPAPAVLVLSMHANEGHVSDAFAAGADGYALKHQPAGEVIDAIRRVHAGRGYVAPGLSRLGVGKPARLGAHEKLASLSVREREIFERLVRGASNKDVSAALTISVKTVESHRMSINRKLDLHSTAELVRFAAVHGLYSE